MVKYNSLSSVPKFKTLKFKSPKFNMPKSSIFLGIKSEGRIRIPSKRRHEVEEKYNHQCAVCGGKLALQIHHKNMKSHDNRLANLELLCSNHHISRHNKKFRKIIGRDLSGRVRKRLVNKKPNTKKKKTRRKTDNILSFKPYDFKF